MKLSRAFLGAAILVRLALGIAHAQELDADPDRVFVSALKWERLAGAPRIEKVRHARGTLVILYREGIYAEVAASFLRKNERLPAGLNLHESFVVRLGNWSRTDDDELIRVESRAVLRNEQRQKVEGEAVTVPGSSSPSAQGPLPGPVTNHTCRLEMPSATHLADTIVCSGGLTVDHPQRPIGLGDFPSLVRRMVASQKIVPGR